MPSDLITERYHYSMTRLTELQNRVKHIEILSRFPQLTIYAAGSYARMEASKHSDIDLFFLHSGKKSDLDGTRMDQQRLFAKLVEIADMMDFPEFTNDGQYLQILFLDDMLRQLGGRHDDYVNHFTARMLLLLESYPIFNKPVYSECIAKIVESYFRDYKDFPSSFRPTFLVNDILRFWKTLCLNYEYERNIAETRTGDAIKHTVKNFKLKFSRMLTCFATVIALTKHREPITQQEVIDLIQFPPRMRLDQVSSYITDAPNFISRVIEEYTWFLEKTGLPQEELHQYLAIPGNETEAFERANQFGTSMYNLLTLCASPHGYMRYIVI